MNMIDSEDSELYSTGFYFAITTIITVGYGDVSAHNNSERFLACGLMLIGVIAFSISTGAISQVIMVYDSSNERHFDKLKLINKMTSVFKLSSEL